MKKCFPAILLLLFMVKEVSGQRIRVFPLRYSQNPAAQVALPWLETDDSISTEAINMRIWQHLLWGHVALEPHWVDSTCSALLLDLHDTLHGLQDASTQLLWQNDSLLTYRTDAEWLGAYLSHTRHYVTLRKRDGSLYFPLDMLDDLALHDLRKSMEEFHQRTIKSHLKEAKKLSRRNPDLLELIAAQCAELPPNPEQWLDSRGVRIRLDCELPHAYRAWDKEIVYLIPTNRASLPSQPRP